LVIRARERVMEMPRYRYEGDAPDAALE